MSDGLAHPGADGARTYNLVRRVAADKASAAVTAFCSSPMEASYTSVTGSTQVGHGVRRFLVWNLGPNCSTLGRHRSLTKR